MLSRASFRAATRSYQSLTKCRMTTSSSSGQVRTTAANTVYNNPLTVHSTFRDDLGQTVRPHGLEWHVAGDSHVSYTAISPDHYNQVFSNIHSEQELSKNAQLRHWIVEAHNRWCFAKDLPFRTEQEIESVTWQPFGDSKGDDSANITNAKQHLKVEWKPQDFSATNKEDRYTISQIDGLLRMDKSAKGEAPPCEVWMNGYFVGMLQPETLDEMIQHLSTIPSIKLVYRKSHANIIIRIERRFSGMIRGHEVFDHLLDNLYAMEDPCILDDKTLIGTATLPDWIMGGELTSRIWIRELDNGNLLCLRPLYRDDLETADRRYQIKKGGKDDDKIRLVKLELERLRHLATLPSPYYEDGVDTTVKNNVDNNEEKKDGVDDLDGFRRVQHKRNRRRFFGL